MSPTRQVQKVESTLVCACACMCMCTRTYARVILCVRKCKLETHDKAVPIGNKVERVYR